MTLRMAPQQHRTFVALRQERGGIASRRVQQAIRRDGVVAIKIDQRLVGQGDQCVERHLGIGVADSDTECGFDVKATPKDRQPSEQPEFLLVQEGDAPVQRRRKRPVPRKRGPVAERGTRAILTTRSGDSKWIRSPQ